MMTETDGQTMTEEMSFMCQSVGIGPVDTREKREGKIERINRGMYSKNCKYWDKQVRSDIADPGQTGPKVIFGVLVFFRIFIVFLS